MYMHYSNNKVFHVEHPLNFLVDPKNTGRVKWMTRPTQPAQRRRPGPAV
jgi:hypothetical protein